MNSDRNIGSRYDSGEGCADGDGDGDRAAVVVIAVAGAVDDRPSGLGLLLRVGVVGLLDPFVGDGPAKKDDELGEADLPGTLLLRVRCR